MSSEGENQEDELKEASGRSKASSDDLSPESPSSHGIDKSFCSECDRSCCSLAVVLPEERKRIMKATKMGFFRSRRIFQKKRGFYLIKGEVCPFLQEGACSIEHVKPLNCTIFPLALTHQGKDADWGISPACPNHRKVSHEFVEHAKMIGQPLLEKHRKEGPLT